MRPALGLGTAKGMAQALALALALAQIQVVLALVQVRRALVQGTALALEKAQVRGRELAPTAALHMEDGTCRDRCHCRCLPCNMGGRRGRGLLQPAAQLVSQGRNPDWYPSPACIRRSRND